MLTTYQPNLLLTSDYEVAKQFILTEDQQTNPRSFNDILETIDHSNPRILISPRKNNQYFESFDFNVGYDKDAVFSLNVNFIDVNDDFERLFLKFIFSEEDFRSKITEFVNTQDFGSDTSYATLFQENPENITEETIQLIASEYSKSISEKYSFNRTFYFVFGINNDYNSIIASNYLYSEVSQSSEGFKKIKVNFQNTGHPLILSDLNKLQVNKNNLREILEDNFYKTYTLYEYEETVDLVDIVKKNQLDKFLKMIIKKLFNKISGKEVIILLPDFNELFNNYKTYNSKSSKTRALQLQSLNINIDAALLSQSNNTIEFFTIVEFLNLIGLTVYNFPLINEQSPQDPKEIPNGKVPPEIIKKLENFKNDQNIKSLLDNEINRPSSTVRAISERSIPDVFSKETEFKDNFLKVLIGYGFLTINRTPRDNLDPVSELPNINEIDVNLPTEQLLDNIVNLIKERTKVRDLETITKEFFSQQLKDFSESIGKPPSIQSAEVEVGESLKIDLTKSKIKFIIIYKTDGTSYANESVIPEIKGYVNFEIFIKDFSNKLSKFSNGIPFKIGFFEECDLQRLSNLKNLAFDYHTTKVPAGSLPLIKDETNTAIVIAEDFLLRNLYLPVTKISNSTLTTGSYPVSLDDIKNYGEDSKYQEMIRREKKKLKKYINSSFNENLNTDVLDYAMSQDNDDSNDPVFPVFVANDSRSNVLSYSIEVDKLHHTSSYSQFIEYMKKQIINELLLEKARTFYGKFLDYNKIKKDFLGFISSQKNIDLSGVFSKITSNIRNGYSPYYLGTGEYTTKATIDDPIGFYGDDGSRYTTRFIGASPEAISSSSRISQILLDHLYLEILTELSEQSNKNNATLKIVTDIKFNPLLLKKKILRELYQKMFRVSIKTLPFFNFNNLEKLYSGAFLIIKNIVNPSFGIGNTYNFLTGIYMIQAFRHVINQTSCYSEFILVKDVDIGGLEE